MREKRSSKKRVLSTVVNREELRGEVQDFANKESWDEFYRRRLGHDASEWYIGWPELAEFLPGQLMWRFPEKQAHDVRILVPGCGNSSLSERLYMVGFSTVVNVDFSRAVIMNMQGLYWIRLPEMKWRVMDMTQLQFLNGSFDAVVDKGGLDSLTDSLVYPRLGNLYLSEVKRVLGDRGKFICLTLAQSHVVDMLFHKFRFGWQVSLHTIAQGNPEEHIFAFVAEKDSPYSLSKISLDMKNYSANPHDDKALELLEEIIKAQEKENGIRTNYVSGHPVTYSLEEVVQGARGNIQPYEPGRGIDLILGEPGVSTFSYSGRLLDANESEEVPTYPYTVYLVPHSKARDIPLSMEGWQLVADDQDTSRLLKVCLDSSNSILSNDEIQVDLSGLAKHFSPFNYDPPGELRFVRAFDEIKRRDSVHKVMSYVTGPITVEDVIYVGGDSKFSRLIFQRSENLIQSEALLSAKKGLSELKNKGTKRKFSERSTADPLRASSSEMVIYRDTLESAYHKAIISGILLIGAYLSLYTRLGDLVKTVILGLGGGLLPMFMRNNIPSLKIEVVELDSAVQCVARDFFDFQQDRKLNVRNGDAIEFVKEKKCGKFDILVLDVDLSERSSGLSCPNPGFLQEPFLLAAQESLSDQGVFILNLITRSSYTRLGAYSCLTKVFGRILRFEVEEDVSEVLFAFKTDHPMRKGYLSEAWDLLDKSLDKEKEWCKFVLDLTKSIDPFR